MTEPSTVAGAVRPLQVLLVGSLVVPLVVLAVGGYLAYEATIARARADLTQAVAVAEEHAIKVFDTHQLIAARINDVVSGLDDEEIRTREKELHERIAREISGLPQVETILVIGSNGRALAYAKWYPVDRAFDFSDRDYFKSLRDIPQSTYYISIIEAGRLDSERHFILARRKERMA